MEFVCKFGTQAGRVMSETREGPSEAELRQRLAASGYYVFSVEPRRALKEKVRSFSQHKIRPDDFLIFNQQFLTLAKSGLPLHKSVELLARQTRSESLRAAADEVREKVRAGALLSEAFEAVGKFPRVYSATLRAGERSGNLDRVLGQYIAFQKISRTFRKKLLSALIYPSVLLVFLVALVSFVITFIVPRFALLYDELHVPLPAATQYVIAFSAGVRQFAAAILLVLGVVFFGIRAARRSPQTRLAWDRLKYRLPVAGKLLLKFSVAEFARTLSTLLQGGIPVVPGLETVQGSVSSPVLAQAIEEAKKEVMGGRALSAALRASGFFPELALDMVEVGETTGALPSMLESLAEFFEEDVNIDLSTLVALIDPLMIGAIALIVAFVLIAFYLPLFSMAAQVQ